MRKIRRARVLGSEMQSGIGRLGSMSHKERFKNEVRRSIYESEYLSKKFALNRWGSLGVHSFSTGASTSGMSDTFMLSSDPFSSGFTFWGSSYTSR
jgi:hypothetical protein